MFSNGSEAVDKLNNIQELFDKQRIRESSPSTPTKTPSPTYVVHETGQVGEFEILPDSETTKNPLSDLKLPISPFSHEKVPDPTTKLFSIDVREYIEDEFEVSNPKISVDSILENTLVVTPNHKKLRVIRKPFSSDVISVCEKKDQFSQASAHDSMSLLRKPGASEDFIRGSGDYRPFQPGGLPTIEKKTAYKVDWEQEKLKIDNLENLLHLPVGINIDIDSSAEKNSTNSTEKASDESVISIDKNIVCVYDKQIEISENDEDEDDEDENIVRLDDVFDRSSFADILEITSREEEEIRKRELEADRKIALAKLREEEKEKAENAKRKSEVENETGLKKSNSFDELMKIEVSGKTKRIKSSGRFARKFEYAITARMQNVVADFSKYVPQMAMEWPFDLDDWQKESIIHIENGENVFVSAHTSSGKTVAAEYAIALSKKHLTRTIYTSPIKTLSNQKFREFKRTFDDVGLITGDVQINPSASCLIMTTEILRSMLYRGADITRDIQYVIFDEIHYINDHERGVVWEEVIILLPKHISVIMLSATIPNTVEFADWIGRTRKRKVFIISTKKRPVPLEHFIFYNAKMYKIVDRASEFLSRGYQSCIVDKNTFEKKRQKKKKHMYRKNMVDWGEIVEGLLKKRLLPTVVFSFSRKKCEVLSQGMPERIDLTSPQEKIRIRKFIETSIKTLSKNDRKLREIEEMKMILLRGIGNHHAGLLPIVKEMVEILFSQGLCKILFATETFAMGVNMPAKTVIFNGLLKHDGFERREILSSEYIQMAGRAGRRGIDRVGHVLVLCERDIPPDSTFRKLILGKSTELQSKFRLTFNMIMNLYRVEEFRVEDMIKRSFSEAHNQKYSLSLGSIRETKARLTDIEDSIICIHQEKKPQVAEYNRNLRKLSELTNSITSFILQSKEKNKFFTTGSIVTFFRKLNGVGVGIVTKINKNNTKIIELIALKLTTKIVNISPTSSLFVEYSPNLIVSEDNPEYYFQNIYERDILAICKNRIGSSIDDVKYRKIAMIALVKMWKFREISMLDRKATKIQNLSFVESFSLREKYIDTLKYQNLCYHCPKLPEHLQQIRKFSAIKKKLDLITFALSDSNLQLLPEFKKRVRVLVELGYLNKKNSIQLKGRVATEVNSCDSIIVTEMLFENFFTELSDNEIVSVLSCLVARSSSRDDDEVELNPRLEYLKNKLYKLAERISEIMDICGLKIGRAEYIKKNVNVTLMQIAYDWCNGKPFDEIASESEIHAGTIVRNIIQMSNVIREVRNCARVIGDLKLMKVLESVNSKIKRDIVFCASLYLQ